MISPCSFSFSASLVVECKFGFRGSESVTASSLSLSFVEEVEESLILLRGRRAVKVEIAQIEAKQLETVVLGSTILR